MAQRVVRNRAGAGLKAKREGDWFENLFAANCQANRIACTRIPDGCKQIGPLRLIRVKTPFDWVISFQGKTALIDTKSIDSKTFQYSKVDQHQIACMGQHTDQGVISGYVIRLRAIDTTVFVPIRVMLDPRIHAYGPGVPGVTVLGQGSQFDVSLIFRAESAMHRWMAQEINHSDASAFDPITHPGHRYRDPRA